MSPSCRNRACNVAACALFALAWSGLAVAQQPAAPLPNQAWADRMAAQLALTPSQREALQAFLATTARSAQISSLSPDQIRAMNLLQRFDVMAQREAAALGDVQAGAAALRKFYDSLSPAQKATFDRETRPKDNPSVAADVVSGAARQRPDYQLPAYTPADWLIKPSAENIGRVYPSRAQQQHLEGKAVLQCTADTDGYLADCVVKSETPPGQGFGNAALEVTAYMRMRPATAYGVPVRGEVTVPVYFALPPRTGAGDASAPASTAPAEAGPN